MNPGENAPALPRPFNLETAVEVLRGGGRRAFSRA